MSQSTSSSKGWVVTFAGLGINLILGVLYAWGVLKKVLVDPKGPWHWTDAQGALPFTISTVTFSFMMIFAGRIQDKLGPKMIATLGGIVLGLGMVLSSYAKTPGMMVLTFGVCVGLGVGLGYSATTPPALKWFPPARKGLIAGIVVAGIGLAAVIMAPLTTSLIAAVGVSKMFLYLGAGSIVIICVLAQLLNNPPAGYVPPPVAAKAGAAPKPAPLARRDVDWAEMLGTPQFWMLWLIMVLTASAGLTIIASIPRIVGEQGGPELAKAYGMKFIMLVAIFNTVGRLVGGFCSDKIGRRNTMVLFFLLQAVNMFCFSKYNTLGLLIFGGAFTGICYGTIFPLFPAATADFYGIKNLGVNYGCVFTAFGVAGAAGPFLAGWVHDMKNSYAPYFIICAVMLLAGAALAAMLKAPKIEPVGYATGAPQREKALK